MHNLDRVLNSQPQFNELEFESGPFGQEFESDGEFEAEDEMLAAELLAVSNEEELDQFLGGLIKRAAKGVASFARSSVGRQLGGILKNVAKTALPTIGGALGSMIPIPGVGTALGSAAGKALAGALEMEAGAEGEDREFEVAKQVVRLASEAARTAVQSAAPGANPSAVAARAVKSALGHLTGGRAGGIASGPGAASGRWIRRGRAIILLGA